MNFDIVFNYILKRTGVDYGSGPAGFARLLKRLGNPQEKFKIVHVAGTNGKGSVATMMACALECAGYKTGLFVSPHLINPVERIQINGMPISKKSFSQVVVEVFQKEEDALNFFEILTAAALVYFARKKVDYVVLETGLGGRKDPTNVCTAALSIITAVGIDHTQYLGSSLAQIAREKAGIIKAGVPVISGAMNPTVREIIAKMAKSKNAPLTFVGQGEPFWESSVDISSGRTLMRTDDGSVWPLHALGARQTLNACVVYQAAKTLGLPDCAVKKAFEIVELAGRFEMFCNGKNTVVLDGAHNPQAVELLMEFWRKTALSENAVLLCGFMKDKDYKKMLALLCPYFKTVIVTVPPSVRGAGEDEIRAALAKNAQIVFEPDWKKALALALTHKKTLCTGSFYLVGAVRARLESKAFKRV
ncbi:MAG: bifunctional folylpolyglutamate synthase/dihydrofolate synthase [Candidatus Avelusimicrobium sp.]|uniref:bifunctional folylpolyglutamate synthase/dihydrofolate synthase n=1 Tax=Candidatus Avelusimicrobium sp. TaxID=3048833 RepID=UPI003F0CA4E5